MTERTVDYTSTATTGGDDAITPGWIMNADGTCTAFYTADQIRQMVERVREDIRQRRLERRLDRLEALVAEDALDALLAQVEERDG